MAHLLHLGHRLHPQLLDALAEDVLLPLNRQLQLPAQVRLLLL